VYAASSDTDIRPNIWYDTFSLARSSYLVSGHCSLLDVDIRSDIRVENSSLASFHSLDSSSSCSTVLPARVRVIGG
jgi:hypothetical protein